jgi:nucleotide-binding universal stress UspA family protein
MKAILLPTDFSENSWNAIVYALNFLEKCSCNFYLLHVNRINNLFDSDSPYIPDQETIENLYAKSSKIKLKEILKRIVKELPNNEKHKFYTLTDYNFFIESIRKHVYEKKIDMIIMGTKGASGLKEYIVGSNTGDVITKVKCTTLVVPEESRFTPLKEIAFPTDYTMDYDIQMLQPILDILEIPDTSLRMLHINKKNTKLNTDQQANKDLLNDYFENYNYSFHFLSNTKVEDAIQCFVESRGIDMMIMIAKNLNYFQQILFHSKIEKISYHTNVPFLVLHE